MSEALRRCEACGRDLVVGQVVHAEDGRVWHACFLDLPAVEPDTAAVGDVEVLPGEVAA